MPRFDYLTFRITPEWVAGFFDGEGTVAIYKDGHPGRKRLKIQVALYQKDPEILYAIKAIHGGHFGLSNGYGYLCWNHIDALRFLKAIRPFLNCKKQKADEAIKLLSERLEICQSSIS